jgi:Tol biopolymer transport system component
MPPGPAESAGTSSKSVQRGDVPLASPGVGRRFRSRSSRALAAGIGIGVIIGAAAYGLAAPGTHHGRRPARLERVIADWPASLNAGLAFSPNGMLLAVAGMQSTAVYNLATGTRTAFVQHHYVGGTVVECASFSPDGKTLVATADANEFVIRLWNVATGKPEPTPPHDRYSSFTQVTYSPDGSMLAAEDNSTGRWGTSTYVWNAASRRILAILSYPNGSLSPLAFSPDGRTLAIANGWGHGRGYGRIHLWDTTARKEVATLDDHRKDGYYAIAYSPDGRVLAAADGHAIYLWDTATGKIKATLTGPRHQDLKSLAFSPDGLSIAANGSGSGTWIWDASTGRLAAAFNNPQGMGAASLAYSPDGRTLATSYYGGDVFLWNVSGLLAVTHAQIGH